MADLRLNQNVWSCFGQKHLLAQELVRSNQKDLQKKGENNGESKGKDESDSEKDKTILPNRLVYIGSLLIFSPNNLSDQYEENHIFQI